MTEAAGGFFLVSFLGTGDKDGIQSHGLCGNAAPARAGQVGAVFRGVGVLTTDMTVYLTRPSAIVGSPTQASDRNREPQPFCVTVSGSSIRGLPLNVSAEKLSLSRRLLFLRLGTTRYRIEDSQFRSACSAEAIP